MDEGLRVLDVALVDVLLGLLEVDLALARHVRLLKLVCLTVLHRHVVHVVLSRLGELENWMSSLILLQVELELT